MRGHKWDGDEGALVLAVTLRTEDYRGDHAADVAVAVQVAPNETVRDLARRLLTLAPKQFSPGELRLSDWIEVRVAEPVPVEDSGAEGAAS